MNTERLTSTIGELTGLQPDVREDTVTKTIEQYTAAIPSSTYLAVALVAMGVSLAAQVAGQGKWGNFIGQWVPTWLLFGLYNKLVKLEGHDREDRGHR
jgi:hypothetical protein